MPDPDALLPAGARAVARGDEGPHVPAVDADWSEAWTFDFAASDGNLGGYVGLVLHPGRHRAWYWAVFVGEGRPVVAVVDHDVPLPRVGLEVRTEGLWAAHNRETALDHWSLGCEAFGVAVDGVPALDGDLRGDRVPFGFDLEWETTGAVVGAVSPGPQSSGRYRMPCRVSGEVLVGAERVDLDGPGHRVHAWGPAIAGAGRWASWTSGTGVEELTCVAAVPPVVGAGGEPAVPSRALGRTVPVEGRPVVGWTTRGPLSR